MRNLLTILYRPTETMRRILAQPRDRMVIPLVLLAAVADSLRTVSTDHIPATPLSSHTIGIVILVCIAVLVAAVGIFYGMAWVVMIVGRLFEGEGTFRGVRSALAWGLVPPILTLLYRVPLIFSSKPGWLIAILMLVQAVLFLWWIALTSITVAEAHRFSAWTALGTLALSSLAPLVVVAAAALTMMMKR